MAGHENSSTFGKSYAHPVCEIDGPATYLGITGRHEHKQNRRGMGMYRNVQLWQSLPAKSNFRKGVISLLLIRTWRFLVRSYLKQVAMKRNTKFNLSSTEYI
jgi:hypothetical protein